MRIYCPKCQAGYEVNENLIPEAGRRLRCGSCGEIFHFDKSGASEILTPAAEAPSAVQDAGRGETQDYLPAEAEVTTEPETAQSDESAPEVAEEKKSALEAATPEVDMKEIFERLTEQSEHLFQEEQKLPRKQRFWLRLKTMLGLNRKFNFRLIGLIAAAGILMVMYTYRYEIVRAVPFMNGIYRAAGIRAKIPGEGLEFQNINWNYSDNDGHRILEVKGFINNPTKRDIDIPVVHVELLDKDTVLLQSINQKPTVASLKADSRVALSIVVKTPSPTAKYVYLTFIDAD